MAAIAKIDIDFGHDKPEMFDSIHRAIVCDELSFGFGDFEDADFELGLFDKENSPKKIVKRLRDAKAAALFGWIRADWSAGISVKGELIEAKNAEGGIIIRIRKDSMMKAEGSVVKFWNIGVCWALPDELNAGMDTLDGVDLSIDFRRGKCFVRKWPC